MTTFSYTITLSDGEMIAVNDAFEHYAAFCKEQLADGPKAPYWAHLRSLEEIQKKLYANAQMMSTSSPCWPKVAGPE